MIYMSDEKKVRSLRLDDETYNKFRALTEELGNHQDCLKALVSSYELEQSKQILSGQATSIDDFKTRISGVIQAYISALELSVNAEERIRGEFAIQIDSQAKTISDLQARIEESKNSYAELKAQTTQELNALKIELNETKKILKTTSDRAQQALQSKEQAERISNMATEQVKQLKEEVENLRNKVEHTNLYKAHAEKVTSELSGLKSQYVKLENKLVDEQTRAEQDKANAVNNAIANTKEQYINKIEELQRKQTEQIQALTIAFASSQTTSKKEVQNTST